MFSEWSCDIRGDNARRLFQAQPANRVQVDRNPLAFAAAVIAAALLQYTSTLGAQEL